MRHTFIGKVIDGKAFIIYTDGNVDIELSRLAKWSWTAIEFVKRFKISK